MCKHSYASFHSKKQVGYNIILSFYANKWQLSHKPDLFVYGPFCKVVQTQYLNTVLVFVCIKYKLQIKQFILLLLYPY